MGNSHSRTIPSVRLELQLDQPAQAGTTLTGRAVVHIPCPPRFHCRFWQRRRLRQSKSAMMEHIVRPGSRLQVDMIGRECIAVMPNRNGTSGTTKNQRNDSSRAGRRTSSRRKDTSLSSWTEGSSSSSSESQYTSTSASASTLSHCHAERRIFAVSCTLFQFPTDARTIQPGILSIPFRIPLPLSLPQSTSYDPSDQKKRREPGFDIGYHITLRLGEHSTIVEPIQVCSAPLRGEPVAVMVEPKTFSIKTISLFSHGTITLGAYLANTQLGRQEYFDLHLACRNDSTVDIVRVEIKLLEHLTWGRDGQHERMAHRNHYHRKKAPRGAATVELLHIYDVDASGVVKSRKNGLRRSFFRGMTRTNSNSMREGSNLQATHQAIYNDLLDGDSVVSLHVPNTARDSYTSSLIQVSHMLEIKAWTAHSRMHNNPSLTVPVRIGTGGGPSLSQSAALPSPTTPPSTSTAGPDERPLQDHGPLPESMLHSTVDEGDIQVAPIDATHHPNHTDLPVAMAILVDEVSIPDYNHSDESAAAAAAALRRRLPEHGAATSLEDLTPVAVPRASVVWLGSNVVLMEELDEAEGTNSSHNTHGDRANGNDDSFHDAHGWEGIEPIPPPPNEALAPALSHQGAPPSMPGTDVNGCGMKPSTDALLRLMSRSVREYDLLEALVQKDPGWDAFFRYLSPSDVGRIISHVHVEFEQPRVAGWLAAQSTIGFTCQHAAAAIRAASGWFRTNVFQRVLPFCVDLEDHSHIMWNELSDWDQIVLAHELHDAMRNARNAAAAASSTPTTTTIAA